MVKLQKKTLLKHFTHGLNPEKFVKSEDYIQILWLPVLFYKR